MEVLLTILLNALILGGFYRLRKSSNEQSRFVRMSKNPVISTLVYSVGGLFLVWSIISTSIFYVDKYETGHVVKKIGGANLENGKIIATNGENGPQATIYGPGWHLSWFIRIWGEVVILPAVEIPPGHFGEVLALDGRSLPEDAVIAPPLPGTSLAIGAPVVEKEEVLFDANAFLDHKRINGYKGLQSTVLKPGLHRINLFLFNVRVTDRNGQTYKYDPSGLTSGRNNRNKPTIITEIPTGHVGVVKSNLDEGWNPRCKDGGQEIEQGNLKAVLVPSGCKGVWQNTYEPGAYFFNPEVYEVTQIPTRAQRWTYKGGYDKCIIDLTLNEDGSFSQERKCDPILFDPKEHADMAIFVKVEGWDIPVELRILVQVNPEDAAAVVAAVGNLKEVEDRIVTPAIRSIVRNIGGGSYKAPLVTESGKLMLDENGEMMVVNRPARALDFQEYRSYLESAFENAIKGEGQKAGLTILEVKIGEPAIPPELLVSRRREQLAQQLSNSFKQEKLAQDERVLAEKSRATANQQNELVKAEIGVQVSEQFKVRRENEGAAEKSFLTQVAEGQKAQANVLGQDRVANLRALEIVMETIQKNPELLTGLNLPKTVVFGEGSGLSGPAAILGNALAREKRD